MPTSVYAWPRTAWTDAFVGLLSVATLRNENMSRFLAVVAVVLFSWCHFLKVGAAKRHLLWRAIINLAGEKKTSRCCIYRRKSFENGQNNLGLIVFFFLRPYSLVLYTGENDNDVCLQSWFVVMCCWHAQSLWTEPRNAIIVTSLFCYYFKQKDDVNSSDA